MLISDFDYELPDGRVARFPPAERDAARLLVWRGGGNLSSERPSGNARDERGEGAYTEVRDRATNERKAASGAISRQISETVFRNIGEVLPPDATLVFNDTRVVRARLAMFRPSGARIEILCLEPHEPADYERAFAARGVPADGSGGGCEWRAMIGNAKKWKSGPVEIRGEEGELLLRAWRVGGADSDSEGLAETSRTGAVPQRGRSQKVRRGDRFCELSVAKEARPEHLGRREGQAGRDSRAEKSPNEAGEIVRFEWPGGETFGELLERLGRVPIPPYLDRDTQPIDSQRYQTVYASVEGSVAAPTAGLHFTSELIDRICEPHTGREAGEQNRSSEGAGADVRDRGAGERNAADGALSRESVTLHVGAGTFLPVKSDDALEHPMHSERFEVSLGTVERLAARLRAGGRIVAVGTTSVRTLESLAVLGWQLKSHNGQGGAPEGFGGDCAYERVKAAEAALFCSTSRPRFFSSAAEAPAGYPRLGTSGELLSLMKFSESDTPFNAATREQSLAPEPLTVEQFSWREVPEDFGGAEALEALAGWMRGRGMERLRAQTRIMITPGYKFRVVGGLVTNFHQPKSTLLLLVSAFTGGRWREIYDYALAHGFRFLSYGDSSLLLP